MFALVENDDVNQPAADHEITRETTWSLENDGTGGSSLHFEGRGWQKRQGESLSSSELGNGTLVLDADTGVESIYLHLDLDRIWMNETYEGTEITRQIFEMHGTGALDFQSNEEGEGVDIEANVHEAYILRDWDNGVLTERMVLEATGSLSFNGGSNNSTEGAYGELSVFYLETWDEDGVRRLSDTQIEANMSIRMNSNDEAFSIELDEFRLREKWLDGVREEQSLKIKGEGEFVFVAEVPGPEDKIAVRLVDGILYVRGTGGFSKEVPIEGANEMQISDFKYRNGVLTLRIK